MKGMSRISRGFGFSGVLKYVFYGQQESERKYKGKLLGGNMASNTAEQISKEFGASKGIRPDIHKPVWHNSLRLKKGERLTSEKWVEIANSYMDKMGFSRNHQRIYMLHDDEEGQHIHIIASRIGIDGILYLGQNENLKSTKIIQELEREFGLIKTAGPAYKNKKIVMPDKSKLKKEEIEKAVRTCEEPVRLQLQKIIDAALEGEVTLTQFVERLEVAGVRVKPNANRERINGFAFELNGLVFSGSRLGNSYKYNKLEERGLTYDKATESLLIERLKAEAKSISDNGRPTSADRASDSVDDAAICVDSRNDAVRTTESSEDRQSVTSRAEKSAATHEDVASSDQSTQPAKNGTAKTSSNGMDLADNQSDSFGFDSSADFADVDIIKSGNRASNELAYARKRAVKKEEQESLARQLEVNHAQPIPPVSHAQFALMLTALASRLDYEQYSGERQQKRIEKRRFKHIKGQVARRLPDLLATMQENPFTGKRDSHNPDFLKSVYEKIMMEQRTDPLRKTINEETNARAIAERLAEIRLEPEYAYKALVTTSYALVDREHAARIVSEAYAKTHADQFGAQELRQKLLELDVKTRREVDQETRKWHQEAAQAQLEEKHQQDKHREKTKQKNRAGPKRKESKHENDLSL